MPSRPTFDPSREFASPADAALAAALRRAGEELRQVPAGVTESHVEAITALAATHAHARLASGPGTTWGSRLRRLVGLTAFKVALGAGVAAAAATGGLAATGNLPDPVQQAVSDGARWVGIDLPAPTAPSTVQADEDAPGEDVTTSRPEAPATAPADDGPDPSAGTPAPAGVSPEDDPESGRPPGSPAPGAPPARPSPDASPRPASSPPAAGSRDPSTPSAPPREPAPGPRPSESAGGGRVPTGATAAGTGTSGTGH